MQRFYIKRFTKLFGLTRNQKRLFMIVSDVFLLIGAVLLSGQLKFGLHWPQHLMIWPLFPLSIVICIPLFIRFSLYRAIVRYSDGQVVLQITKAVISSVILIFLLNELIYPQLIPRSVVLMFGFSVETLVVASRLVVRWIFQDLAAKRTVRYRAAVLGAGEAGVLLVTSMQRGGDIAPIVFLDKREELQGCELLGLDIYSPDKIGALIEKYNLTHVILAMPDAPRQEKSNILRNLGKFSVRVMQVPSLSELDAGIKKIHDLSDVDIADLLGRDVVPPNHNLLGKCIRGKVVMVTGAGGSIGSELCRQIFRQEPVSLVAYEMSEIALYQIDQEITKFKKEYNIKADWFPILGDICNEERVSLVMEHFGVQTIYHAAAYKHVPIVEHNPEMGIKNNILGTEVLAKNAERTGVETFVLISTDKAVRPTNVMGATKRVAELLLQAYAKKKSNTRFCMVRFGNVLGSSGSVVPLFRDLIARGEPVTVTHPDVTRYFMTIPEAAELVLQAGSMGEGGDVFLLDMGEPVKIADLARQMVHLYGLTVQNKDNPNGDIPIIFTGLRPGEKLYEELLIDGKVEKTEHSMIMSSQEKCWEWEIFSKKLKALKEGLQENNSSFLKQLLLDFVEGYTPSKAVQSWTEHSAFPKTSSLDSKPIPFINETFLN